MTATGKPSVTVDCPACGQPVTITYTPIHDPDLPPGHLRVRPTYDHDCANGGEG